MALTHNDTTVTDLVINKLTKEEYDSLSSHSSTELYLVPESVDSSVTQNSSNPVQSGAVFTAIQDAKDVIMCNFINGVPYITEITSLTSMESDGSDGWVEPGTSTAISFTEGEYYIDINTGDVYCYQDSELVDVSTSVNITPSTENIYVDNLTNYIYRWNGTAYVQVGGSGGSGGGEQIQYDTLPTPSATYLGKIFQYVGVTGNDYINGYFYECVSDGESTPTYSWEQKDVMPVPSGGNVRNYIISSNNSFSNSNPGNATIIEYGDALEITCTASSTYSQYYTLNGIPDFKDLIGKTVTFAYDELILSNQNTTDPKIWIFSISQSNNILVMESSLTYPYSYTFTFPDVSSEAQMGILIRMSESKNVSAGDTLTIKGLRLVIGDEPKKWSPAIEDTLNPRSINKNLVFGSASMHSGSDGYSWRASGGTVSTQDLPLIQRPKNDFTTCIRCTNTGSSAANIGIAQDNHIVNFKQGDRLTESLWVRVSNSGTYTISINPFWVSSSSASSNMTVYLTTRWVRLYSIAQVTADYSGTGSLGYFYVQSAPANFYFEVCGMKVELGDDVTDWSPSPNDDSTIKSVWTGNMSSYNSATKTAGTLYLISD